MIYQCVAILDIPCYISVYQYLIFHTMSMCINTRYAMLYQCLSLLDIPSCISVYQYFTDQAVLVCINIRQTRLHQCVSILHRPGCISAASQLARARSRVASLHQPCLGHSSPCCFLVPSARLQKVCFLHSKTDDKLFSLARLRAKIKVRQGQIREMLFADDTALISLTEEDLQRLIVQLAQACI